MDNYLGRMLKNWVASSQPNPEGRERLLAAAARPHLSNRRRFSFEILQYLFPTHQYHGYPEEIISITLSQSTIWSFHMATSNRILA